MQRTDLSLILCWDVADTQILTDAGFAAATYHLDGPCITAPEVNVAGRDVILLSRDNEVTPEVAARVATQLDGLVASLRIVKLSTPRMSTTGQAVDAKEFRESLRNLLAAPTMYLISPLRVHLTAVSDVARETTRYLVAGRVPLGKLASLDGDPGTGKSTITLDLAAAVSTNGIMPDGTRGDLDAPAGVLLLTAEDGIADTIRPRLEAAGADLDRIAVVRGVLDTTGDERHVTLADVDRLEEAIARADAKLVVIDPFSAYLPPKANAYRDQDVRSVLTPLARLAERTGAAIVIVRHLTKARGGDALYRGGGSIGIIGAARIGLLAARDPDDSEGRRHVLAVNKSNLGPIPPALAYRIEAAANGASRVLWDGESDHTATTLLSAPLDAGEWTARDEAEAFLRATLRDGGWRHARCSGRRGQRGSPRRHYGGRSVGWE